LRPPAPDLARRETTGKSSLTNNRFSYDNDFSYDPWTNALGTFGSGKTSFSLPSRGRKCPRRCLRREFSSQDEEGPPGA
jgi:hypothetical protein